MVAILTKKLNSYVSEHCCHEPWLHLLRLFYLTGPMQIIALAHFLNRKIERKIDVYSSPREKYGYGPEAFSLLRVPLNLVSVDGQIR